MEVLAYKKKEGEGLGCYHLHFDSRRLAGRFQPLCGVEEPIMASSSYASETIQWREIRGFVPTELLGANRTTHRWLCYVVCPSIPSLRSKDLKNHLHHDHHKVEMLAKHTCKFIPFASSNHLKHHLYFLSS